MTISKKLIYGLVDPRSNEVRYIGRSSSGMARPRQHICPSRLEKKSHKNHWIKSLLALGLKPTIQILHEFQDDAHEAELNSSEVYFIQRYRALGADLTNATDGGEGATGYIPTPEALEKRRKAMGKWKPTQEQRKRLSASLMGRKVSEETRAKIAASNTGKKHSEETRLKISVVVKARPHKELCKRGHVIADNLYMHPTEGRQCRLCRQFKKRLWEYQRKNTK
jgi:hypothetical protein